MRISYRPEIDGLRTIAVVTVILYHAQATVFGYPIFQGGGIGVDIFFVISGYLITSILLKELIKTGTVSFSSFYERRARRILPPLFVVILTSLPFAYIYLFPSNLVDFSKSILYSLGFSSNFFFHYSGQQYGAEESLLVPFLHTWSLSVEEQYYIFFPLVLMITFKYAKAHLRTVLIASFFISLLLSDWGSRNYPVFNFYVLPTRGWELLAGSILAYYELHSGHRSNNKILNQILPSVGMVMICYSVMFFDDQIMHPSRYTLIPIIGVCLIIWFSGGNEIITRSLSSKGFVAIGLISYALYLWHYPIFAFSRMANLAPSNSLLVWVVLILSSTLSYFFIETPARNKNNRFKPMFFIGLSMFGIIILANILTIKNDGFKTRDHFPVVISNTFSDLDYREIAQNGVDCHDRLGDQGFCIFNDLPDTVGDIVLLGDSLTDALLKNFIEEVSKTKFRLIHMSYSGNLYLPDMVRVRKQSMKIVIDERMHDFRKDFIQNNLSENSYIVIFGDYNFYFEKGLKFDINNEIIEYETSSFFTLRDTVDAGYDDRKVILEGKFRETITELAKDHKVILVYPSPVAPEHILKRIRRNFDAGYFRNDQYYREDEVNYDKGIFKRYNSDVTELLNSINGPTISKVSLESIFCPEEKCFFYNDHHSYIFDTVHTSYEGSKLVNNLIFSAIEDLEAQQALSGN
jgi:peptidoglycan/LPS O-acetylase OafA/YrhL